MDILIKAAQLITCLSLLVVLHEFGHFIAARIFKTRVEKFYLFFNPWFSLYKKKIGDTEYGIGWLPLGGYVKISGMIDESMDKEQLKKPPQPWELRSKPAWQRLIIMLGGVTMNVIAALVIYSMVLFYYGREILPSENLTWGMHCDSLMKSFGMKDGDIITKVGDVVPTDFFDIAKSILIYEPSSITVKREGKEVLISLQEGIGEYFLKNKLKPSLLPRVPFVIDSIIPGKPAAAAGFLKGDSIVSINGKNISFSKDIIEAIRSHPIEAIQVGVIRNHLLQLIKVTPDKEGLIGIANKDIKQYFKTVRLEYSFFQAIPAGIKFGLNTLSDYVTSLKMLFSAEGAKQIGGFGTIGGLFAASWEWHSFWMMTAFISIILAFMNVLPIPALDGGHVMFIFIEIITGRKPSDKVLEYAQFAGMILLLALLIYANGNDLIKAFSN